MKTFKYRSIKNGKTQSGYIEARDEDEAISKLKERGLEILSIKGMEDHSEGFGKTHKKISIGKQSKKKIKKTEKVFFYKNLSTMLKAGLPLLEAIDLIRESTKEQALIDILGQLKYDVEAGNYISDSLSKHKTFKENEIAMIKAGEVGGTLPESFQGLYEDTESEVKLKKDIKGAMMYPAVILSILFLVVLLLLLFVLPQLTGFFEQANIEVPTVTKFTMAISKFAKQNFLLIAIVLVGSIIGIRILIKRSTGFKRIYDKFLLKTPFIGKQLKFFHIYKFARMLGLLIKSGVSIVQAIEIVEKSSTNYLYKNSIRVMKQDVKKGEKLSDTIKKYDDLYPVFVSRMVKVGEKTGNTADSLENISDMYSTELRETLENLSSLIEPLLLVFLGAGVAFIAISVLIPLYSIVSGINQVST